ncbi:MAG: acylphosphatase [Isosphaeraceae bacterium]
MAQVRRRVHYSGHVQGVGFRFTAQRVARDYDVTGFVKNLADGGVEIVAEGSESEVCAFLAEVHSTLEDKIRAISETPLPFDEPNFSDFVIRY